MIDDTRLIRLLNILWTQYKIDCPFADKAEKLFPSAANDHIAFRTVNKGKDNNVVHGIPRIHEFWRAFGYEKKKEYNILSKNIRAIHMEKPGCPKIFISEFMTERLPQAQNYIINNTFGNMNRDVLSMNDLENLSAEELANFFLLNPVPWLPTREQLEELDFISQYVAWVRLFGNMVNHFTLLVNSLEKQVPVAGPPHQPSISDVYHKMKDADIIMKDDIEGEGTELAQTSTKVCPKQVAIKIVHNKEESVGYIMWPYAYYEIAERGMVRFEGFKTEQTQGLFEMTARKEE